MKKNQAQERIEDSEINLIYAASLLRTMENILHSGPCADRIDELAALVIATHDQVRTVQTKLDAL